MATYWKNGCPFGLQYVSTRLLIKFFLHLGFCCGHFFLIAPFPDHCLLLYYQFYITDRSKATLLWWFLLFYVLVFKNIFCAVGALCMLSYFS